MANQFYNQAQKEIDSQMAARRAAIETERQNAINTYNTNKQTYDSARSDALEMLARQQEEARDRQANRMAARGIGYGEGALVNYSRLGDQHQRGRNQLEGAYALQLQKMLSEYQNQLGTVDGRMREYEAERMSGIQQLARQLEERALEMQMKQLQLEQAKQAAAQAALAARGGGGGGYRSYGGGNDTLAVDIAEATPPSYVGDILNRGMEGGGVSRPSASQNLYTAATSSNAYRNASQWAARNMPLTNAVLNRYIPNAVRSVSFAAKTGSLPTGGQKRNTSTGGYARY